MNTENRMWLLNFERYGRKNSRHITLYRTFEDTGQGRNWFSRDTVLLSMMAPFRDRSDILVYHPGKNAKSMAYPVVMGARSVLGFVTSLNPYMKAFNALSMAWHGSNIIDRYNQFPASEEGYYSLGTFVNPHFGQLDKTNKSIADIPGSYSEEELIPTNITHEQWAAQNLAYDRWLKSHQM